MKIRVCFSKFVLKLNIFNSIYPWNDAFLINGKVKTYLLLTQDLLVLYINIMISKNKKNMLSKKLNFHHLVNKLLYNQHFFNILF